MREKTLSRDPSTKTSGTSANAKQPVLGDIMVSEELEER